MASVAPVYRLSQFGQWEKVKKFARNQRQNRRYLLKIFMKLI
jgi:hypothetical protein